MKMKSKILHKSHIIQINWYNNNNIKDKNDKI